MKITFGYNSVALEFEIQQAKPKSQLCQGLSLILRAAQVSIFHLRSLPKVFLHAKIINFSNGKAIHQSIFLEKSKLNERCITKNCYFKTRELLSFLNLIGIGTKVSDIKSDGKSK